jgi:membrane-bound lytic murein transglycosylase B
MASARDSTSGAPGRWKVERKLLRLALTAALSVAAGLAGVVLASRDAAPATGVVPRAAGPEQLAAELSAHDAALRTEIDSWRADADPPSQPPPAELTAEAGYLQATVRSLAGRPRLARSTIELLSAPLAGEIRELTAAARDLHRLSAGWPPHHVKSGDPKALSELEKYYAAARHRYGVGPHYLAAIHHVESKFGRVKSNSVSGAQGPMQFLPSTWQIYGHGDIHNDHDAILAAANLLHHAGAPGNYARALLAYNPSRLYVDAVQRYARLIKRDTYALYFLYCWEP